MLGYKSALAVAMLLGSAVASTQDHWAVLIAGSNTYSNYRHQADVFHAYQIVKENGVPEDQIILFAYDDIAYDRSNPFPGQVFNQPDGEDVYAGVQIDYSGKDVSSKNFLHVLKGDAAAMAGVGTGKVLKSDANSRVFVYYADHGAVGLVAMPSAFDVLYADDLTAALQDMYDNSMYKQLVFYLEACESGSMFDGVLPSNINVYATTAANGEQSSYAAYCSNDVVDGVHIGSCLGDVYSVKWMEDTDAYGVDVATLESQYNTVKKQTHFSEVQEFGETGFKAEIVGNYQGSYDKEVWLNIMNKLRLKRFLSAPHEENDMDAVSSRDAKLASLYNMVLHRPSEEAHVALQEELAHRIRMDSVFSQIAEGKYSLESSFPAPRNFSCLKDTINHYFEKCGDFSDYSLKYVKYFVKECEADIPASLSTLKARISAACQ